MSDGLALIAMGAIRAAIFGLALFNLIWLAPRAWEATRRGMTPRLKLWSALFFLALAALLYQGVYFFAGNPPRLGIERFAVALVQMLAMLIVASLWCERRAIDALSRLMDHLGVALAIVALARVAPERADELAALAIKEAAAQSLAGEARDG